MTPDLEELKRLAEQAKPFVGQMSLDTYSAYYMKMQAFRKAANPETVLSLIKMIEDAKQHEQKIIAELRKYMSQAPEESIIGGIRNLAQAMVSYKGVCKEMEPRLESAEAELEKVKLAAQKVMARWDAGDIGIEYKWDATAIRRDIQELESFVAKGEPNG